VSYVIRVNPSRFGVPSAWVLEDSLEANKLGTLSLTETTSKKSAKKYPTRAEATDVAVRCAAQDPEYIGRLSVQWVPGCGS
jgi:hypothetical protein